MVGFYMDVHIPRAITNGLRIRGVDVLTAQEDNATTMEDAKILDRAGVLNRIVFSFDNDFLKEAHSRQMEGFNFVGVVYAHALRVTVGECVRDLELIAELATLEEMENQVVYLPL
ncbi:MAG: DUF5615 family PIN-like protein [Chitinophagales bacterium]